MHCLSYNVWFYFRRKNCFCQWKTKSFFQLYPALFTQIKCTDERTSTRDHRASHQAYSNPQLFRQGSPRYINLAQAVSYSCLWWFKHEQVCSAFAFLRYKYVPHSKIGFAWRSQVVSQMWRKGIRHCTRSKSMSSVAFWRYVYTNLSAQATVALKQFYFNNLVIPCFKLSKD